MNIDRGYPIAEGDQIEDPKAEKIISDGEVVYMPPETFLAITPSPDWWTGFSEEYERIFIRVKYKLPLDIPYIHMVYNNMEHEGRHRALASIDVGLDMIPVAVLKESFTEKEIEYIEEATNAA